MSGGGKKKKVMKRPLENGGGVVPAEPQQKKQNTTPQKAPAQAPPQQQNNQQKKKKNKNKNKPAGAPAAQLGEAKVPNNIQTKLLINGKWVDAQSGKTFPTLNPATGEVICQVAEGDLADIDLAVKAARAALPGWKKVAPKDKGAMLYRLAELMEKNRVDLATLETLDNGKPRKEAYNVDMNLAINTIRYYAGWADKIHGEVIPIAQPNMCFTKMEPVGVVGQIIPWNFPICMVAWKLGPALAAGNVCVMKPAENTPLSALAIGQLCVEAGFPPGVVNIVNGYGAKAGAALTNHKGIDKIAFTGSTKIGKMIASIAGGNLKRCSLELGGKSPLYIMPDADLDKAVEVAHVGLFLNQGQCCCASSRIFVHEKIYDTFVKKCIEKAKTRQLGDPMADGTTQGPQISQVQFNTIMNYIEAGKKDGAKLATGGKRYGNKGYFIEPTVFYDVKDDMKIAQEEIFGPVMSLLKFNDLEDAIKRGNKTNYGLAAGVFTSNIKTAMNVVNNIDAGTIWVNCYDVLLETNPFGGFKESGIGRELGKIALEHYTECKTVVIDTSV